MNDMKQIPEWAKAAATEIQNWAQSEACLCHEDDLIPVQAAIIARHSPPSPAAQGEEQGAFECASRIYALAEKEANNGMLPSKSDIAKIIMERPAPLPKESEREARLEAALRDLLFVYENADETGYVDGVGFVQDFDDIPDKCRSALTQST